MIMIINNTTMFQSRRYGTIDAMNNKSSFLENDSLRNFQL